MAQQRPIKGLNKGPGNKRFVFKSFSQRVEEVDIDVFRSLVPVKLEPTAGSSFFHESLVAWRELNSAIEFTSIYEVLLPIVQTLPQLILHKEKVMDTLLSNLRLNAIHSLGLILSLMAIMSRDLQADFIPFFPKFFKGCVDLFKSGGEREPDVIEQVFTSISYIFKYLQKHLCEDINSVLKATKGLRYYGPFYIQDFTAEAVSYLLRNASLKQLVKGIRKLFTEVASKPSKESVSSCSSLLWHTLKGPGTTLHSRAEQMLRLFLDDSTFKTVKKKDSGGKVMVEVLSETFSRLCEELDRKKLSLLYACLLDEMNSLLETPSHNMVEKTLEHDNNGVLQNEKQLNGVLHISKDKDVQEKQLILVSLLNNLLEFRNGKQVNDFEPIFHLCHKLLQSNFEETGKEVESSSMSMESSTLRSEHKFQILRLTLAIIKSHGEVVGASIGPSAIISRAHTWAMIWNCPDNSSLLYFMQGLLEQDSAIIQAFFPYLLRTLDHFISMQSEDVLPLMVTFFGKVGKFLQSSTFHELQCQKLVYFVISIVENAMKDLNANVVGANGPVSTWAALNCYPYIVQFHNHDKCLAWDFIRCLDNWLSTTRVSCVNLDKDTQKIWEFVLSTAVMSEMKVLSFRKDANLIQERASETLKLGIKYKNSAHVLNSVADFLDFCFRDQYTINKDEIVPDELRGNRGLSLFGDNLGSSFKLLRLSTLRLLIHLESLSITSLGNEVPDSKKRKGIDGRPCLLSATSDSVFETIRSVEVAPFRVEASRQSSLPLARLKLKACSGTLSEDILVPLTNAVIGILQNPFRLLWDAALDCLAGLLEMQRIPVWETFVQHLSLHQTIFLSKGEKSESENSTSTQDSAIKILFYSDCSRQDKSESTDVATLLCLLLQAAQKIPKVADGRTRQLVPLFLTFVGQSDNDLQSFPEVVKPSCNRKDWKVVLKEWLTLLELMKNPVSYFKSLAVKEVLVNRFLMDGDPEIQSRALECVLNWKDSYLMPYEEHLKNLISFKAAREEMTTWNIGRESEHVKLNHREGLTPIVMRLLFPKILKTKTKLHNKTTGGVQRKVVLSFLAHLDAVELASFFLLIFKPIGCAFTKGSLEHTKEGYPWEIVIKDVVHSNFIECVDLQNIHKLSYKKKSGFLHMVKDILESFGRDQVTPYMHALLAFCFRILQSCKISTGVNVGTSTPEFTTTSGAKDLRTLSFKVLSAVLSKYDELDFPPVYWDIFFGIARPMIIKLKEEAASSDGPSALFSCLLAMSRSIYLVPILEREEELVPNMLPLLSNKNASASIVSAALSFIENILELEAEDMNVASSILLPHMTTLILNMKALLSTQRKFTRRLSPSVKRGLHILIKVSRHINDPLHAVDLLDVILTFLSAEKKADEEEIMDILSVLRELAPRLTLESCEKALPFLAQLLSSNSDMNSRSLICQVLYALSASNAAFSLVAELISDLNAISVSTVGEYDYERRLQGYGRLSAELFSNINYNQATLLISQAVYDIKSEDISIRHSAANCLLIYIHFLRSVYAEHDKDINVLDKEISSCVTNDNSNTSWGLECVQISVQKLLLPNIRKSMSAEEMAVRREWVTVLREMASNLPFISPLAELPPLMSSDPEVDFFNNIVHIQTHRRIKAIARFKELCNANNFSQGTLIRIFKPLFMNSLFEVKGDKDGNLVQSAIEVISCIAAQLQWGPYYSQLMELFRMMTLQSDHVKVLIRLLCAVLDKFHFHETSHENEDYEEIVEDDDVEMSNIKDGFPEDKGLENRVLVTKDEDKCCIPVSIQRQLRARVLPEFTKLMVSKENIINIPVALAVVKVLKLMPKDVVEVELPRIVQNIVNLLKNRSQTVRDEARAGLLAVSSILGASYFGFLIEKLQESLKRGYEVHVLGFTLNALVAKICPALKMGEIDYCVENILRLLENDLFSGVADEKEVEKLAFKMKETKRTRSYESIKLVAQVVTFQLHCGTLLNLVKGRLKDALHPKVKIKVERALRQLALGIQLNPSVKQEELLIFVHGLVEDGVVYEKSGMLVSGGKIVIVKGSPDDLGKVKIPSQHLITEFALHLLESHLKRAKMSKSDPSLLSMLDPLILLLHSCLESKHGAVLHLTLKCLSHLFRFPLPSIAVVGEDLLGIILDMAQKSGKAETQVSQACFHALVAFLKHAKGVNISVEQIRIILQFPLFVDLETAENNTGLVLLKAIVSRKLLIPELYDIINKISNLMVRSHTATVRQYCSQIILQFLLDYPLGGRRLQQHLDFFVSNLSYEYSSGREAVLEMLHAIIVKFPVQAVDEQVETIFLPLVLRLVNEDSNQLRAMVGSILKVFIGKLGQRSLQRVLSFCLSWLKNDKQQLWRAASQVLGLAIESMKEKYSMHLEETFTLSILILNNVMEANNVEKNAVTSVGPVLWKEAYHILLMLEKLLKQFPDVCLSEISQGLWEFVCCFLLHRHMWIRKVSCRLLDTYFVAASALHVSLETMTSFKETGKYTLLFQPSWFMLLLAVLCKQLDSDIDEGLVELIKKNLLFVCSSLHSTLFLSKGRFSWIGFIREDDTYGQARVRKALQILKVQNWIGREANLEGKDGLKKKTKLGKRKCEDELSDAEYYGLMPVFKYLEKISLDANDLQVTGVFHLFESLTTFMGKDGILPYLQSMMLPLYRTTEGVAARIITDKVRTVSENTLNHIKEVIGTGEFVRAYNEVRQMTKDIREDRRRTKKLRVLVDPEGNARRKIKLNTKRQAQKKKKRMANFT